MRHRSPSNLSLIKDRLRGFPNIRKAGNISKTERDTCERYGEHVIGTMLASGLTPPSADLAALYQTEETRQHARDWLTERADHRDTWERWDSLRDLLLEIAVIALIGFEILLSLQGLHEGRDQARVLEHMDHTASATAEAMNAARDSLNSLASAQAASLKILQEEDASRQTQLGKKPKLLLYNGDHLVTGMPTSALQSFRTTDTGITLDLRLWNKGNATANKVQVRIQVNANDVSLAQDFRFNILGPIDPPGSSSNTYQIPVEFIRPRQAIPLPLTLYIPKGHTGFAVLFSVDADEIQTRTPLATITISPREP